MTRLTRSIVDHMKRAAVVKAGITEARKQLAERDEALTEALRIRSLGGAENVAKLERLEKKRQKLIEEAGEYAIDRGSLIPSRNSLKVNLAGANVTRYFFDGDGDIHFRPVNPARQDIEQGDPLVAEFYALEDERKSLDERAETIRASVEGATSQVTTVKKLLELWPEAVELLPTPEQKAAQLPAIQVKDLNTMIGLPSDS